MKNGFEELTRYFHNFKEKKAAEKIEERSVGEKKDEAEWKLHPESPEGPRGNSTENKRRNSKQILCYLLVTEN